MMPRPNSEAMEGGYPGHSYGRATAQGAGGGPPTRPGARDGASGNAGTSAGERGNPNASQQHGNNNNAAMGMPHQGYENEMRVARYAMGPPNMQHHHPMGHHNMDPSGMGMSGYPSRAHEAAMGGSNQGGGGSGGMMSSTQHSQHMGNYPGYPQEMSPNMPRMTTGNMYAMQQQQQQQQQPPQPQQPQQGNSPTYSGRDTAGMAEMGSNSEGRASGMPGGSNASGSGSTGASGSLTQADREEELLLNLLIARRQRSRMTGEPVGRQHDGLYADELLRLGRGRGGAGAPGHPNMPPHGQSAAAMGARGAGGGTLPPMPGMPPLYMDHPVNTLPAVSGHPMNVAYNDHHPHFKSDVVAMNLPIQEGVDQRIDRTPPHLMDARSQDMMMRDFSGRGMKRNPYDMGPPGVPGMHGHPAAQGMGPMKYHMQMQGMDMSGAAAAPTKKKRSHKKKPADMPRRPLSAYNLFFSEERERILKEIDGGDDAGEEGKEETVVKEEEKAAATTSEGGDEAKPKALLRPLIPNQKKRRPHRKTHGKISFQKLARMVGERWKALPDDRRKYYQELAQEDMKRQKQAMEEYYAKQQALKEGRKPHEMGQSPDPNLMYVKQEEAQQPQQTMETEVTEGITDQTTNM